MCILLVEDEPLIRLMLAEELDQEGFELQEAADGDVAIGMIDKAERDYTLLLTDIHLPGRHDGLAVARHFRRHHPAVPVVYMSGRPDVLESIADKGPQDRLLTKPFRPSQLVRLVRELAAAAPITRM